MANQEHLAILKQGVEAWNQWRKEHHILPDLSEANLSKVDLTDVKFSEANLILEPTSVRLPLLVQT